MKKLGIQPAEAIIAVLGNFGRNKLVTHFDPVLFDPGSDMLPLIEQQWSQARQESDRRGSSLFNGPLVRLMNYERKKRVFSLWLQPTQYKHFVGTNLAAPDIPKEKRADPIGISSLIVTDDQKVVIGLRSSKVHQNPGRYHCIGGHLEPKHSSVDPTTGAKVIDPFCAIEEEILEELNIPSDQIRTNTCIGMIIDSPTYQPEMVFATELKVPSGDLQIANDEHYDLAVIDGEKQSIYDFLTSEKNRIVPVAKAALLMLIISKK